MLSGRPRASEGGGTSHGLFFPKSWGHSSVGRAPALQAGCQGFESPYLHSCFMRGSQLFSLSNKEYRNQPEGGRLTSAWQNYIDTNRKIGTTTILWEITISKCRALTHKLHKNQAYKEKLIRKALNRTRERFRNASHRGLTLYKEPKGLW